MRSFVALAVAVGLTWSAGAEEPAQPQYPPDPPAQYPGQQPQYPPDQPPPQQSPPQQQQYPAQQPQPYPAQPPPGDGSTIQVVPPGAPPPFSATPQQPPSAVRHFVTPKMRERWNHARTVAGFGSVIGLVGGGLTVSSLLITVITGYPCNPNDPLHQINNKCGNGTMYKPSKPTDAVPMLAYLGSSLSATGFVFTAAGLGYQHHLLSEFGVDNDRKLFHAGTALGVFGFSAVGLSYFFGSTSYLNPHDQGIAILASTVTGAALCELGSLLFTIDSARTKKIWARVSTW